jgi:hypothetical protein
VILIIIMLMFGSSDPMRHTKKESFDFLAKRLFFLIPSVGSCSQILTGKLILTGRASSENDNELVAKHDIQSLFDVLFTN